MFSHARAEWYLLTATYALFGGGFCCFTTGAFSFISDITTEEKRTSRILVLDVAVFVGFPAGTLISAPLFRFYSILLNACLLSD